MASRDAPLRSARRRLRFLDDRRRLALSLSTMTSIAAPRAASTPWTISSAASSWGSRRSQGLDASRRRWAYAGRLLGDPAASVARAMGALFLQPAASLLWDTYEIGGALVRRTAWSRWPNRSPVFDRSGQGLPPRGSSRRSGELAPGRRPDESIRVRLDQFLGEPARFHDLRRSGPAGGRPWRFPQRPW